ncbi:LysM peptidoglycan-binding domain-containing protein [Oscillibacter sp. MSJ-2]|uniref:LysM peptidoglycan-binding domain-containing protein n=1 Tax=Dysosmobacter acutus TaxID=2841504 RepID=A0ABS6F6I9_9FIRM|nr:LysM peptidoglycan-binding domain-containing protein [Dysosmobacter acutus]MBU5625904.1 LysM peptidoglycan-binding domain-containing protein [Dysosmobacter acutus]
MKKLASLFLALTLCMGLAVPAFAAEYSSYTYNGKNIDTGEDVTITFEAASAAKETLTFAQMEGDPETREVTVLYLKPGSKVTVSNDFYSAYTYELYESGNYGMKPTGDGISTGVVDDAFVGYDIYKLILELSYSDAIYLKLGDSGEPSTPTTPAQPEKPATPTQPEKPATSVQPEQPAQPTAPGNYTVKKGDTWGSICTNFYGDNAQRYALQKANKFVKLDAGKSIVLPEKLGKAVLIAAPVAGEGETLYTVKAGDTLGAIAKATYGDVMKYKAIFERNNDRLKNANTIYEGQVIVLPAK